MKADKVIGLIEMAERKYLGYEEAVIPGGDWTRKHFLYPVSLVLRGLDFAKKEVVIYTALRV